MGCGVLDSRFWVQDLRCRVKKEGAGGGRFRVWGSKVYRGLWAVGCRCRVQGAGCGV